MDSVSVQTNTIFLLMPLAVLVWVNAWSSMSSHTCVYSLAVSKREREGESCDPIDPFDQVMLLFESDCVTTTLFLSPLSRLSRWKYFQSTIASHSVLVSSVTTGRFFFARVFIFSSTSAAAVSQAAVTCRFSKWSRFTFYSDLLSYVDWWTLCYLFHTQTRTHFALNVSGLSCLLLTWNKHTHTGFSWLLFCVCAGNSLTVSLTTQCFAPFSIFNWLSSLCIGVSSFYSSTYQSIHFLLLFILR